MYSAGDSNVLQEVVLVQQSATNPIDVMMSSPAYWNNTVYFTPNGSPILAFPLSAGLLGTPRKTAAKYPGAHSPSISANGNANGILWAISGQLHAFDAVSLQMLYGSGQALNGRDTLPAVGHFATQTVANGRVYVGTRTSLEAYGLFHGVGPVAVLSPISVSFPNQLVGTTSAAQLVTLTNAGSAGSTLTINTKSITGTNASDFKQTNTCGTTLSAGASCTFSATFTPSAVGARGATLNVGTSDLVNPTLSSQLTGTGTAPVAVVSPTSLNFGNQKQQTTSAPQTVTLSNTGTAPLTINGTAIGGTNAGDFKQTTTCGASLAAGAKCTISVTFKPTKKGTRTATLTVTDNSNAVANSKQNVSLSGTGH
jgi:hypothetical protein